MIKNNNVFIVEGLQKSCYIDTLLMSLYYTPSNIYFDMLDCNTKNSNLI